MLFPLLPLPSAPVQTFLRHTLTQSFFAEPSQEVIEQSWSFVGVCMVMASLILATSLILAAKIRTK